ncbi:MAG: polysaccharide biosynthesis protein [Clostridia bacterium]|nr:polysaccharide biosynthesis protein [Clostridia bacterium]
MRKKEIIKNAYFLGLTIFISKIIGALYRIPLTNLLGARGIGIYQVIFPVYCIILDFSAVSAPNAVAKIISSYRGEDREEFSVGILKTALRLFFFLGIVFSVLLVIFSKAIADLQGEKNAYLGYIFIAPAIVGTSLICAFRGYFQGLSDYRPTAFSQISEQLIKLVFGLIFVKLFSFNITTMVAGATLGVSFSEIITFFIMYAVFKKRRLNNGADYRFSKNFYKVWQKVLVKTAIPISLVGIALPLSHFIDSFLIINIINKYADNGTVLFGLLTGSATTIINLPVSVCYGISSVAVPSVSGANDDEKEKNVKTLLVLTAVISFVFAFFIYLFSDFAVKIVYRGLTDYEKAITARLIKITSVNVFFTSLIQTENSVLIGKGKLYTPLFVLSFAVIMKTVLEIILINNPSLNIYGSAYSLITCYFFASLVNLIIISGNKNYANKKYKNRRLYCGE